MSDSSGVTTVALEDEIAKLKANLAEEKAKARAEIRFKVGDKGGLVMYGLGSRFPITLYAEQWEKLLDATDQIREALIVNAEALKRK